MTRSEAIKVLQSYAEHSWGDLNDAFKMAISALRQQDVTDKDVGKMTNAASIRAMSDEELAKAIFNWFCVKEHCDMCVPEMLTPKKCNGRCTSGILRWLQQPTEEDDHDERKENENVRR